MDLSPLSHVSYPTYRIPDGQIVKAPTNPPVPRRTLIGWQICGVLVFIIAIVNTLVR